MSRREADPTEGTTPVAETTCLENESLRVDIAVEPALRITATDKRTGAVWECPASPFILHYWHASSFEVRRCPVDRARGWEFRLIPDDHRISLHCMWPRAACGFRVVLEIDGPSLKIAVPGRRLIENRKPEVRLMALDVLPGFGGAKTGEDGFLLIPHDRGTLCRFDKTDERESAMLLYAGDRALTAPVFGVRRGAAGLLGIIAEGEFTTELVFAANGGPGRNLTYVHPRVRPRLQSADEIDEDANHVLLYRFLDEDAASVAGMAETYRTYLTDVCGQATLRKRAETRPSLPGVAAAVGVHVPLAEKRRKERMTGDGELQIKTRFEDLAAMATQMKSAGLDNVVVTLVGWNCEGQDGLYPTRFPVESDAGGADAMSRAVELVRVQGFHIGTLDNYTDMYRRSPAFNQSYSARQLGGQPWRGGVWAGGQSYIICPQETNERYVQRDMRRLCDLGVEGLLFLDHCPGPGVLRCYDEDHPLTRAEYAREVRKIIEAAQATFGLCRISGPSLFAALTADSCMCPVGTTPSIDGLEPEWFDDEPVPFLPIVLHGLTLLAGDADADPLRVIEYGAAPVYSATATELPRKLPAMAALARRYANEIAPLASAFIESHETPGEGLVAVGYSTGAAVLINRTDEPAEVGGATVGPQDFLVTQ